MQDDQFGALCVQHLHQFAYFRIGLACHPRRCLRPFGLMASFGNASGPVAPFSPGILGTKGSLYVTRQTLFSHIITRESTQEMADELFAMVTSGKVKIRIDQRFALADVAEAHRSLEARKTTGCTILTL